jgi:hypothetical protein
MKTLRYALPLLFAVTMGSAHAQYLKTHDASVSAGGFGQFNTELITDPEPALLPNSPAAGSSVVTNERQYTTWSAGFLTSMQFHPVAWAGVELNYGYTRYSEEFAFQQAATLTSTPTSVFLKVPTNEHEATGAYLFHPKHIMFQPFVGIGGGYIDFNPAYPRATGGTNQWRGAGLLEMGFDLPTMSKHIQFRVEGRSLYYRAPNFDSPRISTRTWRAQTEPVVSAVYRF